MRHLVSDAALASTYDGCLSDPIAPDVLRRIAGLRRSADAYLNAQLV
jgi:hypothetical protein